MPARGDSEPVLTTAEAGRATSLNVHEARAASRTAEESTPAWPAPVRDGGH
jgi:hypothetical protein